MADWVYDRHGNAQIILDGDRFLDRFGNRTIGWINGEILHHHRGSHVGRIEDGVLRDSGNRCIGFTANATGPMPSRPGRSGAAGMLGLTGKPGRPGFSGTPGRSGRGGWSDISLQDCFG